MDRLRELPAMLLLAVGSIGGFFVGLYLGVATEHTIGLIAVLGAFLGAGAGTWLAQSIIAAPPDDEQ
jgi:hypothetical protein